MKHTLLLFLLFLGIISCKSNIEEQGDIQGDDITELNKSLQLHNSRNSLDWAGTYSGLLPCEDCRGIETLIEIKEDQTYRLIQRRTTREEDGPKEESTGNFTWNEQGSTIELVQEPNMPLLKVGENYLVPLDPRGFELKAEPGNNFKLLKL
ncbi:copper resistance protein NlpE [Antarcticibacterium flavum]|uniref:Copper resistance protein NlpE n=1 Tax=Antarcticibacterium flavum TaxID=2058175 RepID=A0A5B7X832_9FLAO|nr:MULTISPECIES: copper resistance protein NlpE [Antarcticibacterium]MCM4159561.1 copper resistance protein NlpE [Antarcticibacterium sp. W02-3]QCY70813.1 copper resistance protein NlpE [Antarcticibacterium flavum]